MRVLARGWIAGLALAVLASGAVADCGAPPGSDAALIEAPRAARAIADARDLLPNAEGRLWRVATEPPSYLVGTFHVATDGIEAPGPVMSRLVTDASRLFVEVEAAALKAAVASFLADPAGLVRATDDRLTDGLSAAERTQARAVFARYGVPLPVADRMRPFVLVGLLSLPPCLVGAAQGPGLDANLERLARDSGVPVEALETVEEQVAALEADPKVMDEVLRLMIARADRAPEDWFTTVALYRGGYVGALWTLMLSNLTEAVGEAEAAAIADAFWQRLVAGRNARMAERLAPALSGGGVVVAVGALHLPGEDGLVALLREAGHTVTRVDEGAPDATSGSPGRSGAGRGR
ncbi:TraB/GumN family protein [Acuticoccus sp.]|uniref:TraB/GumN family protein n=1 Tax=Acuticoccus sp. TaxID=1904378 RepID=UPI003B528A99